MKKPVTLFFGLLKVSFAAGVYFCVYRVFHWGDVVEKVLSKALCEKKNKKDV